MWKEQRWQTITQAKENSAYTAVGGTRRSDRTIDLITHTAQNKATENSACQAAKGTSQHDHITDRITHTVQNHHRTKKSRIEDINSIGKVDDASTVRRSDEKKEINVKLNIVWN